MIDFLKVLPVVLLFLLAAGEPSEEVSSAAVEAVVIPETDVLEETDAISTPLEDDDLEIREASNEILSSILLPLNLIISPISKESATGRSLPDEEEDLFTSIFTLPLSSLQSLLFDNEITEADTVETPIDRSDVSSSESLFSLLISAPFDFFRSDSGPVPPSTRIQPPLERNDEVDEESGSLLTDFLQSSGDAMYSVGSFITRDVLGWEDQEEEEEEESESFRPRFRPARYVSQHTHPHLFQQPPGHLHQRSRFQRFAIPQQLNHRFQQPSILQNANTYPGLEPQFDRFKRDPNNLRKTKQRRKKLSHRKPFADEDSHWTGGYSSHYKMIDNSVQKQRGDKNNFQRSAVHSDKTTAKDQDKHIPFLVINTSNEESHHHHVPPPIDNDVTEQQQFISKQIQEPSPTVNTDTLYREDSIVNKEKRDSKHSNIHHINHFRNYEDLPVKSQIEEQASSNIEVETKLPEKLIFETHDAIGHLNKEQQNVYVRFQSTQDLEPTNKDLKEKSRPRVKFQPLPSKYRVKDIREALKIVMDALEHSPDDEALSLTSLGLENIVNPYLEPDTPQTPTTSLLPELPTTSLSELPTTSLPTLFHPRQRLNQEAPPLISSAGFPIFKRL